MALMGRVPARCVLLLEDLDAAFVRSTNREDDTNDENGSGGSNNVVAVEEVAAGSLKVT